MSSHIQTTLQLMELHVVNSMCVNNIWRGQTHSVRWHGQWRRWWHRWCWRRASTRCFPVNTNQQLLLLLTPRTEESVWGIWMELRLQGHHRFGFVVLPNGQCYLHSGWLFLCLKVLMTPENRDVMSASCFPDQALNLYYVNITVNCSCCFDSRNTDLIVKVLTFNFK